MATLGMATALWLLHIAFQDLYDAGQGGRISLLAILVFGGLLVYFSLIFLFRAAAINDFKSLLRRQ